jgi:hypothetical protein
MRHYIVTMMKGFSMFKCPLCRYSVTTQEFGTQNGNLRTQAARAMNEHAAAAHDCSIPPSPLDAQMSQAR